MPKTTEKQVTEIPGQGTFEGKLVMAALRAQALLVDAMTERCRAMVGIVIGPEAEPQTGSGSKIGRGAALDEPSFEAMAAAQELLICAIHQVMSEADSRGRIIFEEGTLSEVREYLTGIEACAKEIDLKLERLEKATIN